MKRTALVNIICSLLAVIILMLGTAVALVLTGVIDLSVRTIELSSGSATQAYDGHALTNDEWTLTRGELKDGHMLIVEVTGSQREVGISENHIYAKVVDEDGKDVSADYEIEYKPGILKVKERPIIAVADSAIKVYDGTPLTAPTYTLESTSALLSSHEIIATVEGSITEIGTADNVITDFRIVDKNHTDEAGEPIDVSGNYSIVTKKGLLTVTAIPPIPPDDEPGDEPGEDEPGEGGEFPPGTVIFKVTSEKTARIYLKMESYGDYDKTYHPFGDRESFGVAPEFEYMLEGDKSAYYMIPYALDNSGLSTYSIVIDPQVGIFALPYYTFEGGPIQSSDVVMLGDATAPYEVEFFDWDSTAGANLPSRFNTFVSLYDVFVRENYLYLDDETREYMNGIIAEKGFSADDSGVIEKVAAYIKRSADYNLEYDTAVDNSDNPIIAFLDEYEEGVCRHYAAAATALFRAIGIPARYTVGFAADVTAGVETEIKVEQAHAWVEVYVDGMGWVKVEVTGSPRSDAPEEPIKMTVAPINQRVQYVDGMTLEVSDSVTGFTITDGSYVYLADVVGHLDGPGMVTTVIEEFEIFDTDGYLVYRKSTGEGADRFDITYSTGYLHMYISKLIAASVSTSGVYDGTAFTTQLKDCALVGALEDGYTATLTPTGSRIDAGSSASSFTVKIMLGEDDCTDHYWVVNGFGTLTVTPRPITIAAKSDVKTYDGTPLVCNDIEYDPADLAEGHYISEFVVEGSQKNIGKSANVVKSVVIKNAAGDDVTTNYQRTIVDGELKVNPPT